MLIFEKSATVQNRSPTSEAYEEILEVESIKSIREDSSSSSDNQLQSRAKKLKQTVQVVIEPFTLNDGRNKLDEFSIYQQPNFEKMASH